MILRRRAFDESFLSIYASIHAANERAAERFADAVETTLKRLDAAPQSGRRASFANAALQGMRFAPLHRYRNYLIFYRPHDGGIEVVDLVHGARDLETLF